MKFVDEPPATTRRRSGKWSDILKPLRDHPGQWAELDGEYNPGTASHIRSGKPVGIEKGEFEVVSRNARKVSRTKSDGTPYEAEVCTLYVRYVGTPDPEIDAEPEWGDTATPPKEEEDNPFADFLPKVP